MEKVFYRFLSLALGYGLIIGGFIIIGESLEIRIRTLDIIVICIYFTLFSKLMIFSRVNLNDSVHKEIGMLGIHLASLIMCSMLALGFMVYGILYMLAFKYQLLGQLAIFMVLIMGHVAALQSGEKIQHIHDKEQINVSGKNTLSREIDGLSEDVSSIKDIDISTKLRLRSIQEDIRYIVPSTNNDAKSLDNQLIQLTINLRSVLRNYSNNDVIIEGIERIETVLSKRKKY